MWERNYKRERYKESLYFVWQPDDLQADRRCMPSTSVNVGDYYTGSGFLGSQADDVCISCLYSTIITAVTVIIGVTLTCLTRLKIEGAVFYEQCLRPYLFMSAFRIQVASVSSTNVEWEWVIRCQEPLSGALWYQPCKGHQLEAAVGGWRSSFHLFLHP